MDDRNEQTRVNPKVREWRSLVLLITLVVSFLSGSRDLSVLAVYVYADYALICDAL